MESLIGTAVTITFVSIFLAVLVHKRGKHTPWADAVLQSLLNSIIIMIGGSIGCVIVGVFLYWIFQGPSSNSLPLHLERLL